MKIAVFIKSTTFHSGYGGLETQNRTLCEELVRRGHAVTVFAPKKNCEYVEQYLNGVKYYFLDSIYRTLYPMSWEKSWYNKSCKVFTKLHTESPFDVVLSQSSAALGIIKNKKKLGVKVVSIAHGTIISEIDTRFQNLYSLRDMYMLLPDVVFSLYNFFYRQREFVHGSDAVVCVSKYVRDHLLDETYAPEDKVRVIHNGITVTSESHKKSEDFKSILYVGQVIKEKGAQMLRKLSKDSRFADAVFDVIGSGDFLPALQHDKQLNLHLHGKLSFDYLKDFYKSAHVFVFPTRRLEGLPMVLVEAQSFGVPIIAFDMGGVSDIVKNDYNGYLIKPGDYKEFSAKLLKLLNDPDLQKTFSANAKINSASFTLEGMVDSYEEVFKGVLQ